MESTATTPDKVIGLAFKIKKISKNLLFIIIKYKENTFTIRPHLSFLCVCNISSGLFCQIDSYEWLEPLFVR